MTFQTIAYRLFQMTAEGAFAIMFVWVRPVPWWRWAVAGFAVTCVMLAYLLDVGEPSTIAAALGSWVGMVWAVTVAVWMAIDLRLMRRAERAGLKVSRDY